MVDEVIYHLTHFDLEDVRIDFEMNPPVPR